MRVRSFLKPAVFFVLLIVCSGAVLAQSTRSASNVGRRIDDFQRQADKAARDSMNREMRGRKPTKDELREAARIKEETREDLEGLQNAYNEIVVKLSGGTTLETSFVDEAAAKVNKHASRLKANIVFPKPEKEDELSPIAIVGDTRKQLRELSARIYEFLTNPMIENPNVLDLDSVAKARLSLESVIATSEKLKAP